MDVLSKRSECAQVVLAVCRGNTRVPVQAYVPMSFARGEAYQFDWSHEAITLQNPAADGQGGAPALPRLTPPIPSVA